MNYRLNTTGMWVVGILIALALILFGYTFFAGNGETEAPGEQVTNEEPVDTPQETITAQHQFKDGRHIIAGELALPTPCHALDSKAVLIDGNAATVELQFTVNPPADGEMCAQVVTPARFKVTFEAPENASITATLNGNPAPLNLMDVGPGVDLDEFEVYIKG